MPCFSIIFVFLSFQLNLDTALKLQIPEEHDEGHEMRRYSLEDLRELQNKLMLMSGKGDQGQCEVDQFAEVLYYFSFFNLTFYLTMHVS